MYKIGIDLGGTNIKAGIVDAQYNILDEASVKTLAHRPYMEVIDDMANLVLSLIQKNNIPMEDIEGVGIGSPGLIDAANGIVAYSNNFNWENVPLCKELEKRLQKRTAISNDANCAALGEQKAGAAKDCKNVIMITLGTGVGGGIIIDGHIFEGGHAGGAELGHTMLIANGEPCTCGRKGCIEAYVSATALIRDTRRAATKNPSSIIHTLCNHNLDSINGKTVFDAALQNDATALTVKDNYIGYLGEAICDYINVFRPDVVLLSGGVCNQGEALTQPLNEYIKSRCFGTDKAFIPPVRIATLGNHAGTIGAAALLDS